MSRTPFISIITICLNNRVGLQKTEQSLQNQTNSQYQWIVIDGGSSDGSQNLLEKLKPYHWESASDHGIYHAMNKGIKHIHTHYVLFLNAGDILENNNILDDLQKVLDTEKPDFLYADSLEGSNYKAARSHKNSALGMFTHHQAMVYSAKILQHHNIYYSEEYLIAGDYDFTLKFLKHCSTIFYWNKPLCVFEAEGISQRNAIQGRAESFQIRQKHRLVSHIYNVGLFFLQSLNFTCRRYVPALYWFLKRRSAR